MVYKVRLNYCLQIEASSSSEAYRKARELIKKEPSIALNGVERTERSVLKMLLFGV